MAMAASDGPPPSRGKRPLHQANVIHYELLEDKITLNVLLPGPTSKPTQVRLHNEPIFQGPHWCRREHKNTIEQSINILQLQCNRCSNFYAPDCFGKKIQDSIRRRVYEVLCGASMVDRLRKEPLCQFCIGQKSSPMMLNEHLSKNKEVQATVTSTLTLTVHGLRVAEASVHCRLNSEDHRNAKHALSSAVLTRLEEVAAKNRKDHNGDFVPGVSLPPVQSDTDLTSEDGA